MHPFKQTAGGWVFAPMVAIVHPWLGTKLGSQYFVNDTTKAELQPLLKRARYAKRGLEIVFRFALFFLILFLLNGHERLGPFFEGFVCAFVVAFACVI